MIDNKGPCATKFSQNQSWSIDYLTPDDWKSKRIIRKFINSAIYVEKPMLAMPPLRKKSPVFVNDGSDGEYTCRTYDQNETTRRVIRSSCVSLNSFSPRNTEEVDIKKTSPKSAASCSTNSSSDAESQVTVKTNKPDLNATGSEMKLSLTSLTTHGERRAVDTQETHEAIKQWLQKKDEERKKKKMEEAKQKEAKEKQRQEMLEKERENFRKWLAEKKQAEERLRKMKELEEDEKKLKEAEREKRRIENELCFNKWLRRKKKMGLERKIKEKLALIQVFEQKQKRLEDNEKAFDEWLKSSKNKPKPIPLNQGLQSLCSSTSVTYINPVPWIPNIDLPKKPVSQ